MNVRYLVFTVLLGLVLCFPWTVSAHSGRTDSSGGHNCNVGSCAGTYHYHNSGYSVPAPFYKAPTNIPTSRPTRTPTARPTNTATPIPTTTPVTSTNTPTPKTEVMGASTVNSDASGLGGLLTLGSVGLGYYGIRKLFKKKSVEV